MLDNRAVPELFKFKFPWKGLAWPFRTAWWLEQEASPGLCHTDTQLWHGAKGAGKPESDSQLHHLEATWHWDCHLFSVSLNFLISSETVVMIPWYSACYPRFSRTFSLGSQCPLRYVAWQLQSKFYKGWEKYMWFSKENTNSKALNCLVKAKILT